MDLIDRDELELDTEWSEYYDGYMSYSQSQINGAPTVRAISLDNVKKARKEIADRVYRYSGSGNEVTQAYCDGFKASLEILDKLIAESEE